MASRWHGGRKKRQARIAAGAIFSWPHLHEQFGHVLYPAPQGHPYVQCQICKGVFHLRDDKVIIQAYGTVHRVCNSSRRGLTACPCPATLDVKGSGVGAWSPHQPVRWIMRYICTQGHATFDDNTAVETVVCLVASQQQAIHAGYAWGMN